MSTAMICIKVNPNPTLENKLRIIGAWKNDDACNLIEDFDVKRFTLISFPQYLKLPRLNYYYLCRGNRYF